MAAKQKSKSRRAAPKVKAKPKAAAAAGNLVNTGHQIWLAGLGALARAQSEGPKLFESLVAEGSAIHERRRETVQRFVKDALEDLRGNVEARVESVRGKTSETLENLEEIFQTRVKKALQQLGVPTSDEIHSLSRKVNELNRSVQTLTRNSPRAAGANQDDKAADEGAVI